MRYVVLSLLALNIAYFAWQMSRTEQNGPRISIRSESVPAIQMLSELTVQDTIEQTIDEAVSNPLVSDGAGGDNCTALGPFEDIVSGQEVLERLRALDRETALRAVDEQTGEYDYRVMLPPAASLAEAFRKLRELQAQDIDSYVITKGKDSLAISLGVYSTEEAAGKAQQEHASDGYETVLTRIARLHRSYWILSESTTHLSLPDKFLDTVRTTHAEVALRATPCEL